MSNPDPTAHSGPSSGSGKGGDVLGWARDMLSTGAIILGEVHTKEFTREFILQLIEAGLVTRLFIELWDFETTFAEKGAPTIGKHLRTRRGHDLASDQVWTSQASLFYRGLADKLKNKVPISTLIERAVAAGVKVYLIDGELGVQTTTDGMVKRNAFMAREYLRVMNKTSKKDPRKTLEMRSVGSVILVGAAHLNGPRSIQVECKIDDNRAKDLSYL